MTTLAEIRAGVDEYVNARDNVSSVHDGSHKRYHAAKFVLDMNVVSWLTDLLGVAEAAGELATSLNDNGCTVGTYKLLSKLDDALAKLEGDNSKTG